MEDSVNGKWANIVREGNVYDITSEFTGFEGPN
jgi:hypothetical protein